MARLAAAPLLFLAFLAGCGAPPAPVTIPPEPGPTAAVPPVPTPTASVPEPVVPVVPVTSGETPAPPADWQGRNTVIGASRLLADLKRIGVDPTRPLSDLSFQKKKALMPLFVKALGYDGCGGCHVEGDFERETRNVRVARKMWQSFVTPLRDAQGGAVFCDSCHAGRAKSLDRTHLEGLQRIMETDYVGKLRRADKKEHDCTGCHGLLPELRIIEKLWKIGGK